MAAAAPGFVDADHPRLTPTLGYSWPAAVCEKLDWLLLRGLCVANEVERGRTGYLRNRQRR